jgi:hypothetical protein
VTTARHSTTTPRVYTKDEPGRQRGADWVVNFDIGHHACILVPQDMAVEYEPTQDQGVSERHSQFHLTALRNKHGINIASKRDRPAVDLNDLEADLVNVEDVHIVGIVAYRPFFNVAQRYSEIHPARVEQFAVDKKALGLGLRCSGLGKHDLARCVDPDRAQIRGRHCGCRRDCQR